MSEEISRPKLGLALSGSGNRTTFYVGFLEGLAEQNIHIDYIAASSGASMVSAAFACGNLQEFKKEVLSLDKKKFKEYLGSGKRGGLYSLDNMENKLREFTKGKTFDQVRPMMSFTTVDIETGEQVDLCIGDIARAVRISCTLPGAFEPVKWGNRTLVDGGLLSLVPVDSLKKFPVDVTIGVNMRGTKHIFTEGQITMKKILNLMGRALFLQQATAFFKNLVDDEDSEENVDFERNPTTFTVINKSLNLAIAAEKTDGNADLSCDLMITPTIPPFKGNIFTQLNPYYELGKKIAFEYGPKIQEIVKQKSLASEKVRA